MTQAITLKWLGPTNHKGARWKATAAAGSLTVDQHAFYNATADGSVERAKECGVACPEGFTLWLYLIERGWDGCWVISQDHKGDYVACQYATSQEVFGTDGRISIKLS